MTKLGKKLLCVVAVVQITLHGPNPIDRETDNLCVDIRYPDSIR